MISAFRANRTWTTPYAALPSPPASSVGFAISAAVIAAALLGGIAAEKAGPILPHWMALPVAAVTAVVLACALAVCVQGRLRVLSLRVAASLALAMSAGRAAECIVPGLQFDGVLGLPVMPGVTVPAFSGAYIMLAFSAALACSSVRGRTAATLSSLLSGHMVTLLSVSVVSWLAELAAGGTATTPYPSVWPLSLAACAVFLSRPDSSIVETFTGRSPGALVARRLLALSVPSAAALALAAVWATHHQLVGTSVLPVTAFFCFLAGSASLGSVIVKRQVDRHNASIQTANAYLEAATLIHDHAQRAAAAGSWSYDRDSGVFAATSPLKALYGIPESEVVDEQTFNDMLIRDPSMTPEPHPFSALPEEGHFVRLIRIRRRDGTERYLDVTATAVCAGGRRMFFGLSQDVTDRHEMQAGLEEAVRNLTEARTYAQNLLRDIAHQVTQPLQVIALHADFVLRAGDIALAEASVAEIHLQNRFLKRFTNHLMGLAALQDGREIRAPDEPFSVDALLSKVLRDQIAETLGPLPSVTLVPCGLWAKSDRTQVEKTLGAIVSNALKFSGGRKVLIGAKRQGGNVCFVVGDRGPGIPARQHDFMFRELASPGGPLRGTSLSLAIARKRARLLGTDIGFRSVVGTGSIFWMQVPAYSPALRAAQDAGTMRGLAALFCNPGPVKATICAELLLSKLDVADASLVMGGAPPDVVIAVGGATALAEIAQIRSRHNQTFRIPAVLVLDEDWAPSAHALQADGISLVKFAPGGRGLREVVERSLDSFGD